MTQNDSYFGNTRSSTKEQVHVPVHVHVHERVRIQQNTHMIPYTKFLIKDFDIFKSILEAFLF